MSIRYKIERNYNFSPVLLSNGSKIAININETGNSCKIIYDPSIPKSNGYYNYEVIDNKDQKFIKIENESQIQSSLLTNHEENQVLKRRHYFDNTTKISDPLIKCNDRKYTPSSCWELRSKVHSVQELSDKFEVDNYNQTLYKSSSKLLERKLAFLISGHQSKKYNFVNGFWRKSQNVDYPFRSQPIGINSSDNSLSRSRTPTKFKYGSYKHVDYVPEKRLTESKFSSTISIPVINSRNCYSSINISGTDYKISNKLNKDKTESIANDNYGSLKSMDSLFINSQIAETIDISLNDSKKENINDNTPFYIQDTTERNAFRENIIKIKSLLRPVDQNGSFKYKNVHRLKKKSNSLLDKKIMFFEKWTNSTTKKDYDESVSSLHSKNSSTVDFDYSTISLNDI